MDIEKIIRSWKADGDTWEAPASPIARELTEEELLQISGGDNCVISLCTNTCPESCTTTCGACSLDTSTGNPCPFFTLF